MEINFDKAPLVVMAEANLAVLQQLWQTAYAAGHEYTSAPPDRTIAQMLADGHTLVNAPRPMDARYNFSGPFRHGTYYGIGRAVHYAMKWRELDCWPVLILNDSQAAALVQAHLLPERLDFWAGLDLAELPDLARESYGLPWGNKGLSHVR